MRWFRRKTIPARQPLPPEPLGPDLYQHLVCELSSVSAAARRNARWVMNAEWLSECIKLADSRIPVGTTACILGIPVEVRDDGGAPHLEPAP